MTCQTRSLPWNIYVNLLFRITGECIALIHSDDSIVVFVPRFSTLPKCVYDMEALEILLVSDNQINSIVIDELKKLRRLATLDFTNNSIGSIPPELGNMTQLRYWWRFAHTTQIETTIGYIFMKLLWLILINILDIWNWGATVFGNLDMPCWNKVPKLFCRISETEFQNRRSKNQYFPLCHIRRTSFASTKRKMFQIIRDVL